MFQDLELQLGDVIILTYEVMLKTEPCLFASDGHFMAPDAILQVLHCFSNLDKITGTFY